MNLPFTIKQFMAVFEAYNLAVWPMQIVIYVLGLAAVVLAIRKTRASDRAIAGVLSFLWLWMGIAYHLASFTQINRLAYGFGALFIVEGILLLVFGVGKRTLSFRFEPSIYSLIGGLFILYALAVYPLLGGAAGHRYPAAPGFGLPCPTTIFTFGILLWTDRRVPFRLFAIPLLWSVIGFQAALLLGVPEDYGLLAAGVVGAVLLIARDRERFAPPEGGRR
jgi:hypothetical protein